MVFLQLVLLQEQEEVEGSHEDTQEEETEEDHPHQIPYNRFRQVNEERKEFRSLVDEQSGQIEEMQEQIQRLMQGNATKQDEEKIADVLYDVDAEDVDWDKWRKNIAQQMDEMRVDRAQLQLERELDAVAKQFPDVPQNAILQAVADDGTIDLMDFAESYTEFINDVKEGAVAQYVKDNASKTKSGARPRVSSAGSSSSGDSSPPKTMEGAQVALLKHLKEM